MNRGRSAAVALALAAAASLGFVHAASAQAWTQVVFSPNPIAQPGTLPANSNIQICVQPEDSSGNHLAEANVYLTFWSGLFTTQAGASGGTATVNGTALTSTPQAFATQARCTFTTESGGTSTAANAVQVSYTSPPNVPSTGQQPTAGRDILVGSQNAADQGPNGQCNSGTVCNNDVYVFAPVHAYSFAPPGATCSAPAASPPPTPCDIASPGSLAAGQQVTDTVTALDTNGMPVPGAFIFMCFSSTAAAHGSATETDANGTAHIPTCSTPPVFVKTMAMNNGTVTITYTAGPRQGSGADIFHLQDHATPSLIGLGEYKYSAANVNAIVMDGFGGIHEFGNVATNTSPGPTYWPNHDLWKTIVELPDHSGGYTLDAWGGLHQFGSASALSEPAGTYQPGKNIYRDFVLAPNHTGGYILDGYGGIHNVGTAPAIFSPYYTYGRDINIGIVLRSNGTSGWVLDKSGGLHAFGGAPAETGPALSSPVARVLLLDSDTGGYVVDGWGGIHNFGTAPATFGAFWNPNFDIIRGASEYRTSTGGGVAGYLVDGYGGIHQFGGAPATAGTFGAYWPGWDIARSITAVS